MNKVLVIGGAGYIGSHVAYELLNEGYSVRIYDDFSNGLHRRVNEKFRDIVEGDILDREKLIEAMHGIDAVIHLAAKKAVGESVTNPLKYYENNVGGTLNIFAAMLAKKVKTIVFSSSAAVYSPNDKDAVEESDATVPLSPYGATKLLSEQLITSVGEAEKISHISLRYFNVVGSAISEFGDNSKDNLVPKVFSALKSGNRPEIYGSSYPTPDGTCIRDYVHVADLCEAHWLALQSLAQGEGSQAYNLGNGDGFSVFEVIDTVRKVTGREFTVKHETRRAGDPSRLVADSSAARQKLGWVPKYPSMQTIVEHAWAFEQRR